MMRHIAAIAKNSRDGHNLDPKKDGWGIHIEGSCGELAASLATGRSWPGSVGTYKTEPDVLGFEVRTRSCHDWDLNVRTNDADDAIFVLVTGKVPHFVVHGWLRAGDGKRPEFWTDHGQRGAPAWFIPKALLQPLETLPPVGRLCDGG